MKRVASTAQPLLQAFRGLLLITEICIMIAGFVYVGLVESHAIFAGYPLVIAALSGPVLGGGLIILAGMFTIFRGRSAA